MRTLSSLLTHHTARVNVVFHLSPLSFIFFLLRGFSCYFTSLLPAVSFYFPLCSFLILATVTHSTLPHVLAPSLTHHTYQPHDPSPSPLQHIFSPLTFLYSTHSAANSPFTQSHHSLHLFLPLYSHTPPHLFPPFLLPHQPLTPHIHCTGIPIPVINNVSKKHY